MEGDQNQQQSPHSLDQKSPTDIVSREDLNRLEAEILNKVNNSIT